MNVVFRSLPAKCRQSHVHKRLWKSQAIEPGAVKTGKSTALGNIGAIFPAPCFPIIHRGCLRWAAQPAPVVNRPLYPPIPPTLYSAIDHPLTAWLEKT